MITIVLEITTLSTVIPLLTNITILSRVLFVLCPVLPQIRHEEKSKGDPENHMVLFVMSDDIEQIEVLGIIERRCPLMFLVFLFVGGD
uniref:Uncharacterized protein n=1 Tax=Romanomermis culicivorax TaxID=13658 RepID=A0A915L7D7_ROMCU